MSMPYFLYTFRLFFYLSFVCWNAVFCSVGGNLVTLIHLETALFLIRIFKALNNFLLCYSFPDTEQAFCFWLNMFHGNEVLSCTDQNTSLSLHDRQFEIFLEEILIYQNKSSTLTKCNDFFVWRLLFSSEQKPHSNLFSLEAWQSIKLVGYVIRCGRL